MIYTSDPAAPQTQGEKRQRIVSSSSSAEINKVLSAEESHVFEVQQHLD